MGEARDAKLFATLVSLADTLVAGFDVVDTADELVAASEELLDLAATGILLEDRDGQLRILASSNEEMRLLDLMQVQASEGPCWDASQTGEFVSEPDLAQSNRWPRFAPLAREMGFGAVFAIPLQLRGRTLGALNLFRWEPGPLSTRDRQVGDVLASIATIGLVNHQSIRHKEELAEQLQQALNARIVIEQAKGVIAERAGVDAGVAFNVLRNVARSSRRSIVDIAGEVVSGRFDLQAIPRKRSGLDLAPERGGG